MNKTPTAQSGQRRVLFSLGILCALSVAATSAAFTDHATLNFGTGAPGSGIGNPNRFDIAVKDASGTLQDAATPTAAVVLPLTTGTALSESSPVRLDVRFENRNPGVPGDLLLQVFDPDDTGEGDLFRNLRFTMYVNGSSTPAVTGATAGQLNAAAVTAPNVAPGDGVDVRYDILIAPGTGVASLGKTTQIGASAKGTSR